MISKNSIKKIHIQAVALFYQNHIYQYEGMWLKYVWHIVMPCLPLILYNVLSLIGVFSSAENSLPRAVSVSLGITFYFVFSESLSGFSQCLELNKKFITRTGVGFIACYLSTGYVVFMNFIIRYIVFILLLIIYPQFINIRLCYGPLFFIFVIMFAGGLGAIISVFVVFYKDLQNLIRAITFYMLFASGVFGFVGDSTLAGQIVRKLPSYIYVENAKLTILNSGMIQWKYLILLLVVSLLLILISIIINRNSKPLVMNYLK